MLQEVSGSVAGRRMAHSDEILRARSPLAALSGAVLALQQAAVSSLCAGHMPLSEIMLGSLY